MRLLLFSLLAPLPQQKREQEVTEKQVSRKEVEKREKIRQEEMKRELEKVKKRRIVSSILSSVTVEDIFITHDHGAFTQEREKEKEARDEEMVRTNHSASSSLILRPFT